MDAALNWYLIYTKSKCEDNAAKKFTDNGFEVLNPKISERRVIRRKLQNVIGPLFPCYIFVRFDSPKDYNLVKYTRGVRKIVGTKNAPLIVPDAIIAGVRSRMEEGVVTITPRFKSGDDVLIKAGSFEGFNAVFERELKGMERVSILLKSINVRIVVDSAILGAD